MDFHLPLADPELFGNDAAEDETDEVFDSYALDRPEVDRFVSATSPLRIVRAYKGEGKSALLRITRARIQVNPATVGLIVNTPASFISPEIASADFSVWVRAWKKCLLSRIASEVGSQIGFAWTDDQMNLVEEAERNGFKTRNIVGAILRRFRPEGEAGGVKMALIQPGLSDQTDLSSVLHRWAKDKAPLWLFIDDVDQNFQNTPDQKNKVASFFVACRELVNAIPELRIRAAIRPNVWTTVKLEYEALSHVEQYVTDLRWSEQSVLQLMSKRIEGYLRRTAELKEHWQQFEYDSDKDYKLMELVFEPRMQWGQGTRPPHVVLYTLSKHRPRWMVELSKIAGRRAFDQRHTVVTREDIFSELAAFGERRIQDTIAEFRSQCAEVGEILAAFRNAKEEMSTADLLDIIKRRVLNHISPRIVGVIGKAGCTK